MDPSNGGKLLVEEVLVGAKSFGRGEARLGQKFSERNNMFACKKGFVMEGDVVRAYCVD
jgi:hypothetical protein